MADEVVEGKGVLQGRYELGRVLGYGNFGRVHAARDLRTGRAVAMKVVAKEKVEHAGMVEQIKREIAVMKMVSHPNIVELHEVMATRTKVYLALELVRGGELFHRIARHGRVGEDVARRYFRQLVSAVDFCHSRGVYHRDLKPENLLLDEAGNLKVADFGFSALAGHASPDGLLHTACGTPAYVAPEVLGGKGYDGAKADLWSCGVILYVLLIGALPFQDDNLMSMYRKMQRGDFLCPPWVCSCTGRLTYHSEGRTLRVGSADASEGTAAGRLQAQLQASVTILAVSPGLEFEGLDHARKPDTDVTATRSSPMPR
ncbi:hypothetical protein ABZP36_035758 [Zizania latifolia]